MSHPADAWTLWTRDLASHLECWAFVAAGDEPDLRRLEAQAGVGRRRAPGRHEAVVLPPGESPLLPGPDAGGEVARG